MGRSIGFLLLFVSISFGQSFIPWEKVDTLTSGDFDDFNPSLDRGGLTSGEYTQTVHPGYQWLVFERITDSESRIIAKRFSLTDAKWEMTEHVLSSASLPTRQRFPQVATRYPFIAADSTRLSLAVWQVDDSVYSHLELRRIGSGINVNPIPVELPGDGIGSTNPRVFANPDSGFDLFWGNGVALMHSRILPSSVSTSDTIAVFSDSSFEFDVFSADTCWLIARTFYDSERKAGLTGGVLDKSARAAYRERDSLFCGDSLSSPRYLMNSDIWFQGAGHLAVNSFTHGRWHIAVVRQTGEHIESLPWLPQEDSGTVSNLCGWGSWGHGNISSMKGTERVECLYPLNVAVWEESPGSETVLVSGKSFPLGSALPLTSFDTLRQPGVSRHPDIGSVIFAVNGYYAIFSAMVWENNSTGRNHLYASIPLMSIDLAVQDAPNPPLSFSLSQNYPNPFNPTTRISYQLSAVSHVRLTIYDVLGRKVETLVDSQQTPGEHTVVFDGRGLASGVYFSRLQSDGYTQVRKMILMK